MQVNQILWFVVVEYLGIVEKNDGFFPSEIFRFSLEHEDRFHDGEFAFRG